MHKKFPAGKIIWLFIFFGIGFSCLANFSWMMYRDIHRAQESLNFVPTQATVEQNSLQSRPDGHRLALTYAYTIDGKTYTSSRYKFGIEKRDFGEFSKHPAAQDMRRFHKQNPVGTKITVFVNPTNSSDATVAQGSVYLWYETLIITVMTIAFGIGLFLTVFFPRLAAKKFESSDPS